MIDSYCDGVHVSRYCYPGLHRVAIKNCKYKPKSLNLNTLETTIYVRIMDQIPFHIDKTLSVC